MEAKKYMETVDYQAQINISKLILKANLLPEKQIHLVCYLCSDMQKNSYT